MFVFSRHNASIVELIDPETLQVSTSLSDTKHEMIMNVYISYPDLIIKDIEAHMLRMPGEECKPSLENMKAIIGLEVGAGLTRRIVERVGNKQGCIHLTDMVVESAKAAIQARYILKYKHLEEQEGKLALREELKDICVYYTDKKA